MFLGTGAVWQATLLLPGRRPPRRPQGRLRRLSPRWPPRSPGRSSAAPIPNDPTRIDRPYQITFARRQGHRRRDRHLLLLATTLDKLILGTRPFWGGKPGPIARLATIPYPVPSIAPLAPSAHVWRRGPGRAEGARSLSGERLRGRRPARLSSSTANSSNRPPARRCVSKPASNSPMFAADGQSDRADRRSRHSQLSTVRCHPTSGPWRRIFCDGIRRLPRSWPMAPASGASARGESLIDLYVLIEREEDVSANRLSRLPPVSCRPMSITPKPDVTTGHCAPNTPS